MGDGQWAMTDVTDGKDGQMEVLNQTKRQTDRPGEILVQMRYNNALNSKVNIKKIENFFFQSNFRMKSFNRLTFVPWLSQMNLEAKILLSHECRD